MLLPILLVIHESVLRLQSFADYTGSQKMYMANNDLLTYFSPLKTDWTVKYREN